MKNALLALALIGVAVAAVYFYPTSGPYFPVVGYADANGLRFTLLHEPVISERGCQDITKGLAAPLLERCPACVHQVQCLTAVPPEWREVFDGSPVKTYRVRAGKQRILVGGAQAGTVCGLLEQQLRSQGQESASCLAPGT